MCLCQILFVPSSHLSLGLCFTSLIFHSECIDIDFLDKVAKLNSWLLKLLGKKKKKDSVLTSMLHLTFSNSSRLFELFCGLILLTRVKNTECQ